MTRTLARLAAGAALAGLLATALAVSALPSAAHAHDQVLSTTPASQEHLDAAPEEVSMVFTADILDIGATILVVDDAGADWAVGDMQLEGATATQTVDTAMPNGRYQVRWRVVSSDGHPIAGTLEFAVGEFTASTGSPGDGSTPAPEETLAAATDSTSGRNDPVAPPYVVIGIGGALAGIAVFAVVILLLPRRRSTPPSADAHKP